LHIDVDDMPLEEALMHYNAIADEQAKADADYKRKRGAS
jgi:hypothetical protein